MDLIIKMMLAGQVSSKLSLPKALLLACPLLIIFFNVKIFIALSLILLLSINRF